ncbi:MULTISPECIES: molybdopterin-binding protein [Actinosynnema]|uniref:molybdopterin-binding protein n=1 Tax=Actinosynnema TaxID=40566 RepID=UPI0020A5B59B|nr:molybdopterin-binding protein [Actinosynnema pretiosum]
MLPGVVRVTGDVGREWAFATADLHAHAREPFNVRYSTERAREVHHVQGVPLCELLARVELREAAGGKVDRLNFVVSVRSADGYGVVLSWAEFDPEFGACAALLATRYNGRLLDLPTLVLPGDARSSRYVRDVCVLTVSRVGALPVPRPATP